jgi:hypothetical protein
MAKRLIESILCTSLICFGVVNSNAAPVQWKVEDGGNDHWYEAFVSPSWILWSDAATAANQFGGYLATITSAEENDFVYQLIENEAYWTDAQSIPGDLDGPWLGGYKLSNEWHWVSGETIGTTQLPSRCFMTLLVRAICQL